MESRPQLLFVDDESSIRVLMPAVLARHGFQVTAAGTVSEALNLIATHHFDVLVSDLNIGEPGDGFTVVSAMRRTHPDAATFILTGYPAFESALEAIRQQVDDYFVKPADAETLVSRILAKLEDRAQSATAFPPEGCRGSSRNTGLRSSRGGSIAPRRTSASRPADYPASNWPIM